jgi:probable HAF family extracellular repeat protein
VGVSFTWTAEGGFVDLGTLGEGYTNTWANAVNDLGQVVGASFVAGWSSSHAFLWTAEGGMTDLGTLGGASSSAADINNHGQVVGHSDTAGGEVHAALWTVPVPVVTPADAIGHARERVAGLAEEGVLDDGQANSLTSKLEAAQHQLDRGNSAAAVNVLSAFINQVDAIVRSGRLTEEAAQPLIDSANTAIELIQGAA